MNFTKQIFLDPEIAFDPEAFQTYIQNRFKADQNSYRVVKRSIDARGSNTKVFLSLEFFRGKTPTYNERLQPRDVSKSNPVVIVGSGPAGLFAAIELIHQGLKPIVIERGKDVQARRRDIAAINKEHKVDPNSNYLINVHFRLKF